MYPYNKLYRFDRSIALSPQYQLGMYIYIIVAPNIMLRVDPPTLAGG